MFFIIFIERNALFLVLIGSIGGGFRVRVVPMSLGCDVILIDSRITLF